MLRNVSVDFQDLPGIELHGGTLSANVPWETSWKGCRKRFFSSGDFVGILGVDEVSRKNKSRIQPDKEVDKVGSRKRKESA